MRASHRRRLAVRSARFESMEPRLLFSADPAIQTLSASQMPSALATADINTLVGLTSALTSYGFDGSGQTVVIIDTGIAYTHTALGGGYGAGYTVVGGYDFAERDSNPYDDGSLGSHGTHVAGIIAGQDPMVRGVAPGVDLVSLRVFDDAGNCKFEWIEQALQWVHSHLNSFANPITTINLSLGTSTNSITAPQWSTIEDELAILEADGVFISVAAGNSFATYRAPGLSYPASSSYVVPVMSVDADGALSYYSQRYNTAIAAPGRSILSAVPDYVGNRNGVDDDFARYSGTSMAAPYVAAVSVLLRQAYEFVGVTKVTQDMLYTLMRNTADTIYDAVTGQNYLRLNVDRALGTIMPTDDYGSTVATASQLGSIASTKSISGAIAHLGDHDYFTFTAGASGQVTFTVNASGISGSMKTHWDLATGSTTTASQGNTITFQVIAGQTYTLGLGSADGLGRYTITAQLKADPPPAPDTTTAGQQVHWRNNQIGASGQWFSFTATQQGIATFEAFFATAKGDVDLEVYDANRRFLAGSYGIGNSERVDVTAAAGQKFYVYAYVSGWEVNGDVDLRATNLVSQSGGVVTVSGTQGDDVFTFTAGTTHTLSVNGVSYSFFGTSVSRVVFNGGSGNDTVTMTGTKANETAAFQVGQVELTGAKFTAIATGVETIIVNGGGGADTASLTDSAGNDTFTASPTEATLVGQGFSMRVVGFSQVQASASKGGVDTALLYDSSDADLLVAKPTESTLSSSKYKLIAKGFDTVTARATAGGMDQAYLYDSTGDDTLVRRDNYCILSGTGFSNRVDAFEDVQVIASKGTDTAYLYDSALADYFRAFSNTAMVSNSQSSVWAYSFDRVYAYGTAPTDRRQLAAVDYLLQLLGTWG